MVITNPVLRTKKPVSLGNDKEIISLLFCLAEVEMLIIARGVRGVRGGYGADVLP